MKKKYKDIEGFLSVLLSNPDVPLRFYLGDNAIKQGYHVSEIKHASVKSMDCGRQSDAWDELIVQLLDGNENSNTGYMSTSKFASIIKATRQSVPEHTVPFLYFEFAPNNTQLSKLNIRTIKCDATELSVYLSHLVADCKPVRRWAQAMSGSALEKKPTDANKSNCCFSAISCCV